MYTPPPSLPAGHPSPSLPTGHPSIVESTPEHICNPSVVVPLVSCGHPPPNALQVASALVGKRLEEVQLDTYAAKRLRDDMEMLLNSFKNASYTLGFNAGKHHGNQQY